MSEVDFKTSSAIWLGSASAIFFCVNQYLSLSGFSFVPAFLAIAVFVISCFAFFLTRSRCVFVFAVVVLLFGFPEFAANPYIENYVSPFLVAKFFVIAFLATLVSLKFSWLNLSILLLIFITSFAVMLFSGNSGNMGAEIIYALIFIAFLSLNFDSLSPYSKTISTTVEFFFYLLIPVAVIIDFFNLGDNRGGDGSVYFFGHWFGIVCSFVFFQVYSGRSNIKIPYVVKQSLLFFTVYYCSYSFQSVHFIMIFLAILMSLFVQTKKSLFFYVSTFIVLVSCPVIMYLLLEYLSPSDWLYLKLSQVFLLFSGGFIGVSDSVTIRFAQLQALVVQSNLFSFFVGQGVSSTYTAIGELWNYVVLHDATYPKDQLDSAVYQYVHESIVMLFKWGGVILLVSSFFIAGRRLNGAGWFSLGGFLSILFLVLFTSSLHTCLLLFFLYFCVRSNSVSN